MAKAGPIGHGAKEVVNVAGTERYRICHLAESGMRVPQTPNNTALFAFDQKVCCSWQFGCHCRCAHASVIQKSPGLQMGRITQTFPRMTPLGSRGKIGTVKMCTCYAGATGRSIQKTVADFEEPVDLV